MDFKILGLALRTVSIKGAANILNCHVDTVRRAIRNGQLKAFQINKRGQWQITIEEIEKFMKGVI